MLKNVNADSRTIGSLNPIDVVRDWLDNSFNLMIREII